MFDAFSNNGFSLLVDEPEIDRSEGLHLPISSMLNYDAGAGGIKAQKVLDNLRYQASLIKGLFL